MSRSTRKPRSGSTRVLVSEAPTAGLLRLPELRRRQTGHLSGRVQAPRQPGCGALDALDASLGVGVTERPLASFAVPDRFDIDDFFVARHVEERDVQIVTRAFCDPLSDGENRKPFDEALLRTVLREPLSERRARAILVPYVIENTADESLYGGITFRHFDPMRGVIEIG